MGAKVGLWIDHKKATIVTITDKGEEIGSIISKVDKHPGRSGDSPLKGPYEPHQVPAQDIQQRSFTEHLNMYYDAVVGSIRNAESILILGPARRRGSSRNVSKSTVSAHALRLSKRLTK